VSEEVLSRGILCSHLISDVRDGGKRTFAFFYRDETPEASETGFGEFGLRGLIGDFCCECGGRGVELDWSGRSVES
jgi:hypothetical protein